MPTPNGATTCCERHAAACAWMASAQRLQDELALARYEADKWKEKYLAERERRRSLARTLLDVMDKSSHERVLHVGGGEEADGTRRRRRSSSSRGIDLAESPAANGARSRRSSSSAWTHRERIDSLLSPTLSSFDFDDDDEEEEEEEDDGDDDDDGDKELLSGDAFESATTSTRATGSVGTADEEDKVITLTMKEAEIYMKDMCGEQLGALDITPVDGKSFYEQLQDHLSQVVRSSQYESFLEDFSQTQLFCQYCESVLKPMQSA
ncbi:hypothetical protein P43SY_000192 [Pythium insidiosum]|uniref:Uncharacterized protein n=1 Tax=Pythium insidiosum TaxID=114742 RepID=A0AAD5QA32_PYTIN|nr:hypothetical protein P43SY_000192 [Pythium insidiosum]